jgi:hypothetical protein
VISKQIFFIDFLDDLGLFIGEKPIFTKKKIPSLCRRLPFVAVQMKILSARFLKDGFKLVLFFIFDLKNKFRREAPIRIFGSFFTFT